MTASTYHVISKEVENQIFKYNYVFINNPLLQKQRSTIFLCKYYLVISDTLVGSFLNVLFLLFGVIFVNYLPLPKWRSCGMAPMKIYFLLWVVLCDIMIERLKMRKSPTVSYYTLFYKQRFSFRLSLSVAEVFHELSFKCCFSVA